MTRSPRTADTAPTSPRVNRTPTSTTTSTSDPTNRTTIRPPTAPEPEPFGAVRRTRAPFWPPQDPLFQSFIAPRNVRHGHTKQSAIPERRPHASQEALQAEGRAGCGPAAGPRGGRLRDLPRRCVPRAGQPGTLPLQGRLLRL